MWTFVAVIAVIFFYVIVVYNGLVARRNQVREAWATVDTQLKRRYDLIPNLVETVRGSAQHERETLDAVITARNSAMTMSGPSKADAENRLTQTLKSLFAVAESYPDLKANENFISLQNDLKETEDKISYARQFYNDAVLTYNNKVEMIPSNIVANMTGFKKAMFFEAEEALKEAPKVSF